MCTVLLPPSVNPTAIKYINMSIPVVIRNGLHIVFFKLYCFFTEITLRLYNRN